MFLLLSVANEVFSRIMKMRVLYRQMGVDTSATRDASDLLGGVRHSFGGRLVVLDWDTGRVVAEKAVSGATGLAIGDLAIFAASWIDQCVYVVSLDGSVSSLTHRWFNYIHSIDLTPWGTLLLASAGSDLIVEMTPSGDVVWEWFGPEHGYAVGPDGTVTFFDREADYRPLRRATADLAMHVNSATAVDERTILATMFRFGRLVAIDRSSGQARTVVNGLSRPHGVHRHPNGFMLSDTLGHRILLLNENLELRGEIPFGHQWLQDAVATSAGTYVTLENVHIEQLPEAGLANSITEIDEAGAPLRRLEVGVDSRLFTVREIDACLAGKLGDQWGDPVSGDLHWTTQPVAQHCSTSGKPW